MKNKPTPSIERLLDDAFHSPENAQRREAALQAMRDYPDILPEKLLLNQIRGIGNYSSHRWEQGKAGASLLADLLDAYKTAAKGRHLPLPVEHAAALCKWPKELGDEAVMLLEKLKPFGFDPAKAVCASDAYGTHHHHMIVGSPQILLLEHAKNTPAVMDWLLQNGAPLKRQDRDNKTRTLLQDLVLSSRSTTTVKDYSPTEMLNKILSAVEHRGEDTHAYVNHSSVEANSAFAEVVNNMLRIFPSDPYLTAQRQLQAEWLIALCKNGADLAFAAIRWPNEKWVSNALHDAYRKGEWPGGYPEFQTFLEQKIAPLLTPEQRAALAESTCSFAQAHRALPPESQKSWLGRYASDVPENRQR